MGFFHGFSQIRQLFPRRLSRIALLKDPHRLSRKIRPIFPDLPDQILFIRKGYMFILQDLLKLLPCLAVDHPPVKAQGAALRNHLFKIFLYGGDSLLVHTAQGKSASLKLLCRLDKIPSIGPQSRLMGCHHSGSR